MKRFFLTMSMLLMVVAFAFPANAERFPYADAYDFYVTHDLKLKDGATFSGLTRSRILPLTSFILGGSADSTGYPISYDGGTAPGLDIIDDVPAIVWADDEVTPVKVTFRLPPDYTESLSFRLLGSTSSDTTPPEIDWILWFNNDAAVFAASATSNPQTAVSLAASTATNEEVTLTVNSSGLTSCTAGTWITLEIWPSTAGSGTMELKGVEALYK